jgi:putative effector of murein hydrolase
MHLESIKKNILDLQFQKYLITASTSIIIAFTYTIGVGIAILSKQIRLDNFNDMAVVFVISSGILGLCVALFLNSLFHIKNIPLALKTL